MATNKFTVKVKQHTYNLIKASVKFKTPDKIVKDFLDYCDTLMTEDELQKARFLRNNTDGEFKVGIYPQISSSSVLGHYASGHPLIIPERVLELDEFKNKAAAIRTENEEFTNLLSKIKMEVFRCNGIRDFKERLPQFVKQLEKAIDDIYGPATKNLPATKVELPNLEKFFEVNTNESSKI